MSKTKKTGPARRRIKPGKQRVTAELSTDMARRLAVAAAHAGVDYGEIIEPALKAWLNGSRYTDTSIGAPADTTLKLSEADGGKAA